MTDSEQAKIARAYIKRVVWSSVKVPLSVLLFALSVTGGAVLVAVIIKAVMK